MPRPLLRPLADLRPQPSASPSHPQRALICPGLKSNSIAPPPPSLHKFHPVSCCTPFMLQQRQAGPATPFCCLPLHCHLCLSYTHTLLTALKSNSMPPTQEGAPKPSLHIPFLHAPHILGGAFLFYQCTSLCYNNLSSSLDSNLKGLVIARYHWRQHLPCIWLSSAYW